MVRISNAQGEEISLLNFGNGFLSYEYCEDVETGYGWSEEQCSVQTPGNVIQTQLNESLGFGTDRLTVADEIDEIIGALFAQLAQQVLTGAGGLLGSTASGYNNSSTSYLDALDQDTSRLGFSNSSASIQTSIQTELEYITLQQQIVDLITEADQYAIQNSCSSLRISTSLQTQRNNALQEITATEVLVNQLIQLESEYLNATGPIDELDVMNRYSDLRTSELLHTSLDNNLVLSRDIGNQNSGLIQTLNTFREEVDEDCSNGGGPGKLKLEDMII
jgi:hypothetical protein